MYVACVKGFRSTALMENKKKRLTAEPLTAFRIDERMRSSQVSFDPAILLLRDMG